jgi:hypothetical protein
VSAPEAAEPATVYVVYLPYLPLGERMDVGDWELVPRDELGPGDSVDARTVTLAEGLADLYVLPDGAKSRAGAFARPRTGLVGDASVDGEQLRDLHRACVVTVLDPNESPLLPEGERDPNFGHRAMTSDNAIVVAHGINREHGFTGSVAGSRVRRMSLGISVLEDSLGPHIPRTTIPPPADLRVPVLRPRALDGEYCDAIWESMRRGTDAGRRLGRAVDWLDLAWLNATGLTDDLRIPALRAGFEVLLDSDDSDELGERLRLLVLDQSVPVRRSWCNLAGNPASGELSDVAWWFKRFSFLRNDLMHGRSPDRDAWLHDGTLHTDLAEWYLRQAVKHTVANDGHDDILEALVWRDAVRAMREWWQGQHTQDHGTDAPGGADG